MSTDVNKLVAIIVKNIKTLMDTAPKEISAYVGQYLRDPSDQQGLKKSQKTGNLYYKEKNTTSRLRTLYGNIQRAITPGRTGNISTVEYRNGHFYLEFAIDTDARVRAGTKTTTLAYAAMHEASERGKSTAPARPFIEPGFAEYFSDPSGWDGLRDKMEDMIVREIRKGL